MTITEPKPDQPVDPSSAVSDEVIDAVMAGVDAGGLELLGPDGVLAELTERLIERGLGEELSDHLGYEPGDPAGRGSGNNRNGTSPKSVLTDIGAVDLDVPRDRNGTFDPLLVPKHARRLKGFSANIVHLYACGLSTRDIRRELARMYQVEVSPALISRVTDGIVDELNEWQARPLDAVYPIVYIDALVVKVRTQGTVINRAACLAVGVDVEGRKHVLGVWLGDGGEGAKFWLSVLTEVRNRGVDDVLLVCCDGLKGLRRDRGDLAQRLGADLCDPPDPGVAALRLMERPQSSHLGAAADLHRSDRRRRRRRDGHLRARVGRPLPRHRQGVARGVGAVHPVPAVPARDPQSRLHHQLGREHQLPAAQDHQDPRSLPHRRRSVEAAAPRRPQHQRQARRRLGHRHLGMETGAQRLRNPLPRPTRPHLT